MGSKIKELIHKGLIPDWLDKIFYQSVTPLINLFSRIHLNPNWLTFMGFIMNVIASIFIIYAHFGIACAFIIIGGIFDFIDGKVAKSTGQMTKFGAIFDSVLDRYSDALLYLGIMVYYIMHDHNILAVLSIIALIGSLLTSYIKAIGESHGFRFRIGALRRQERITLISIGLLFSFAHNSIENIMSNIMNHFNHSIDNLPIMPLSFIIYILCILTNFSAVQRLTFLLKKSRESEIDE